MYIYHNNPVHYYNCKLKSDDLAGVFHQLIELACRNAQLYSMCAWDCYPSLVCADWNTHLSQRVSRRLENIFF